MVDFDGLGDHRGDNRKKLRRAVIVAVGLIFQVDAERADCLPIDLDGSADESQFLSAARCFPKAQSIQKHRFVAYLRHDDRLACFDDSARDPLTDSVLDSPNSALVQAMRSDYAQFIRIRVEQHY